MRTIEKVIYNYSELTENAQKKALEIYCQGEEYAQDTEQQCEVLKMLGFDEAKVFCSGFYSQGDGSCFEGVWYAGQLDVDKIKNEYPQWTELHNIAEALLSIKNEYPIFKAKIIQVGRYYHENSMTIVQCVDDESEDVECEAEIMNECKSLSRLFHKQFEEDYEYRTSEEAFAEHCLCNDYEFYEDGSSY